MATLRRVEDIQAWQNARGPVCENHKSTAKGSPVRNFDFRESNCKAVVSSTSNLAEGFARKSDKAYVRFPDVAGGSAIKVPCLPSVTLDACCIDEPEFEKLSRLAEKATPLIGSFTSYLRGFQAKQRPESEAP